MRARLLDGSGRLVEAIAYVVERSHPSYCGRLPLTAQVRLIRAARGISGCNLTYLANTVRHLQKLGVREPELARLLVLAGPHLARCHEAKHLDRSARSLSAVFRRGPITAPLLRPGERRRFNHRKKIAEWALG